MPEFSGAEVADAVSRYRSRDRAPGPDGITSHIWGVVHDTTYDGRIRLQRMLKDRNLPGALETHQSGAYQQTGKASGFALFVPSVVPS